MSHPDRPDFICHMMQTLDGKIASGIPGEEIIMDFFDLYTETEAKLAAKVWMFGRKTAAAFAEPTTELAQEASADESDFIVGKDVDTFAVVIDTQGLLRWNKNFIHLSSQTAEFHLITIVTKQTPKTYLGYLKSKDISYLVCGEEETDLVAAAKKLKTLFGIEKVLLEGGGSFNGSMMAAGLVDELSLLLLPRVLNRKAAPALFDQDTSELQPTDYQLQSSTPLEKGVLWLRYSR